MLLRTDFDHAGCEPHLFADCAMFAKKVVLTKRIRWFEPRSAKKVPLSARWIVGFAAAAGEDNLVVVAVKQRRDPGTRYCMRSLCLD
jgi:hypothetical protein